MLLTEKEASTKWCPQCPRPQLQMSISGNCIGSKCMLWTFIGPPRYVDGVPTGEPAKGFCGLGSGPSLGDDA